MRCCLKVVVFFSIFSSGEHFVQPSGTILAFSNFGKGAYEEQFCKIILESGHWKMSF